MKNAHAWLLSCALGLSLSPVTSAQTDAPAPNPAAESPAQESPAQESFVKTESGLQYADTKVGSGAVARAGSHVQVHYTGWLKSRYTGLGKQFDSSRDSNEPFRFTIGDGEVIAGWDEGVQGMRVGGMRRLIVPPSLGYGERGAGAAIPPRATLVFDVELLQVNGGGDQ